MFFKRISSPEYEKLHAELLELLRKLEEMRLRIDNLEARQRSFQGRFYALVGKENDEDGKLYNGLLPNE